MRHNVAGLVALLNGGAVGYWILYDKYFKFGLEKSFYEDGVAGVVFAAAVNGDLMPAAIVAGVSFVLSYVSLSLMGVSFIGSLIVISVVWTWHHAPPPDRKVMRELFVINSCATPMELAVEYFSTPKSETLNKSGWWQINAGEKRYLADYSGSRVEVSGQSVYLYVRSLPLGERILYGSDGPEEFSGEKLSFADVFYGVDAGSVFMLTLDCTKDDGV